MPRSPVVPTSPPATIGMSNDRGSTPTMVVGVNLAMFGLIDRGVVMMVLREAIALAIVGAVAGCIAAVGAGRLVASVLYGTEPSDPVVLGSAALAMVVVVVLATLLPARSASRADPSVLLRTT